LALLLLLLFLLQELCTLWICRNLFVLSRAKSSESSNVVPLVGWWILML
jgi:hypothetical protein